MRRVSWLNCVTSGSLLIMAACALTANSAENSKSLKTSSEFAVVEHANTDTVIDNPPDGDSLGDLLAFGNPIYNASNKKQIGKNEGFCVRTKVGKSWECTWTLTLNAGSIVVQGPFYDHSDSTLAITGGSGAWDNVQGTMHLQVRTKDTFTFTYNVKR